MKPDNSSIVITNRGTQILRVYLEPWPEVHSLQLGQEVEIHIERAAGSSGAAFQIVWSENDLVIHPAGSMTNFVDIYATRNSVKLKTEE